MDKDPRGVEAFWNRRAEHFPRFEDGEGYESSMLELAKSLGVVFEGRRVLDAGCGSGMYTLRLAREAAKVTGVDLSERMLAINAADAQALGLTNVEYVHSGWLEYQPEGTFEVVFCSMCPAMREGRAKEKLLALAAEVLVFIGFVEYFDPEPMARLIAHYGLTPKRFDSGPDMADWLTAGGHRFESRRARGRWMVHRPREAARDWCRTMLGDFGVAEPDPAVIDQCLAPSWDEAAQAHRFDSPYHVEMIVWRPGGA